MVYFYNGILLLLPHARTQLQEAVRSPASDLLRHSSIDLDLIQQGLDRRWFQLAVKRGFDVSVSFLALLCLLPVWLGVAVAIYLESGHPVFFRQKRVGYRARSVTMYKFRSMKVADDPVLVAKQRKAAAVGVLVKGRIDPRVTRFGRLLRRSSLDELPQLLNVLKGEMSLVGPRPLLPFMLIPHGRDAEARALVRPGLTGLWQIRDRSNNLTAAAMMPHDIEYIEHFSLALDLKILVRTPAAVVSSRGAV